MKNPILFIGIILFITFVMTNRDQLFDRKNKIRPTSCRSVLVMLEKRIPKYWKTTCDKNNLLTEIDGTSLFPTTLKIEDERTNSYRELANAFVFLAKNSPSDGIERVDTVTISLNTLHFTVAGKSEGKNVVKFQTLKEEENIVAHLKLTVLTQELKK